MLGDDEGLDDGPCQWTRSTQDRTGAQGATGTSSSIDHDVAPAHQITDTGTTHQGTHMHDFREIGQRLSNWGRWGDDDERGTVNLITPDKIVAASALVETRRDLRPRHPLRRQGPAARRRADQPRAADERDRASTKSSRARSTTPTTTCSCRCSRRRSGTACRTCSTTSRCTTASRPATSARTAPSTARSTRWPRASSAAACCWTSLG